MCRSLCAPAGCSQSLLCCNNSQLSLRAGWVFGQQSRPACIGIEFHSGFPPNFNIYSIYGHPWHFTMNLVGMQTKKRSRPNKGDGEHLRKKCPQGCSCPFQHEYQHNLEFSHDVQKSPTTVARGWGENERNSRITNINQVYLPTSEGRKLGGTNIFVKPDRSRFLSQFQSKIHSAKSIPSKEAVVYGDLYEVVDLTSIENPSLSTQLNDPDLVQCNSCGAHIPMNLFCQHMESHNFSDATQFNNYNPWDTECGGRYIGDRVLRQRQDEEYEQSILHDIERQSAIDQDERLIRDMEDIRQQQAVVIESQREYIRLKQLGEIVFIFLSKSVIYWIFEFLTLRRRTSTCEAEASSRAK